jgi:hypothetical protein
MFRANVQWLAADARALGKNLGKVATGIGDRARQWAGGPCARWRSKIAARRPTRMPRSSSSRRRAASRCRSPQVPSSG